MATYYILILAVTAVVALPAPTPEDDISDIFVNDMRFEESHDGEFAKNGIQGSRSRWEGAVVPYMFSGFSTDEKKIITDGMKLISSTTCVTFKERGSESNYVAIRRGGRSSGCYSYVGKTRGGQELNLEGNSHCMQPGVAAHELIHAIGFFHEMQRPDRDETIKVLFENVQRGAEGNFEKMKDSKTYDVPYDLMSIMHYGNKAASRNGKYTMVLKDGSAANMGQIKKLSDNDIEKINLMYGC